MPGFVLLSPTGKKQNWRCVAGAHLAGRPPCVTKTIARRCVTLSGGASNVPWDPSENLRFGVASPELKTAAVQALNTIANS